MENRNEETVDRTNLSSRIQNPATAENGKTTSPVTTTGEACTDTPGKLPEQAAGTIAPSACKDSDLIPFFQALYGSPTLKVVFVEVDKDAGIATIHVISTSTSYVNPRNGHILTERHGKYERTLSDLPCRDMKCILKLVSNKYRDQEEEMATGKKRVIVTEQFPGLTRKYGRDTTGLEEEIIKTYATSYSAISSLVTLEGKMVSISGSKVLRLVSDAKVEVNRKGVTDLMIDDVLEYTDSEGRKVYLTGIHDAKTCMLLEYIESRDSGKVGETLAEYPDLARVSCDMADCYINAINIASKKLGRPIEIAVDKFHFAKSQRKATLREYYDFKDNVIMREALSSLGVDIDSESMGLGLPLSAVNAEPTDRKKAAFAEVHRLKEESPGCSDAEIAKLTGLCPATVSLYLSQEQPKGNVRHNYVDFWDYLPSLTEVTYRNAFI